MKPASAQVVPIVLLALWGASCADPFIESTTVLEDTSDAVGPYTVETVAIGARSGDRIEIHHTSPEAQDGIVIMTNIGDDGDGEGDLYRGEIPGQAAPASIGYFVLLVRGDTILDRDPPAEGLDGPRFVFSVTP